MQPIAFFRVIFLQQFVYISFGALKLQLLFFLLAVMKQVQAVLKVPSMAPQLIGIVRRLPILLHLYMPDLFFCNLLANHIHAVAQQCRNRSILC
tara:strand:- start:29 stop:310 length:282 start_codon:yes stop_codon:yes gene_type:complete